jgi:hypothetical protein
MTVLRLSAHAVPPADQLTAMRGSYAASGSVARRRSLQPVEAVGQSDSFGVGLSLNRPWYINASRTRRVVSNASCRRFAIDTDQAIVLG